MTMWRTFIALPLRGVAGSPEFNLALFALLLNFPWEIMQAGLFAGMANAPYAEAIEGCTQATLGDVLITLLAYGAVALAARNRRWLLAPSGRQLAAFIGIGLSITALIEWLATNGRWVKSWTYSTSMPLLPGTEIGLAPLLQWVVVPLLVLWFVRRQSAHRGGGEAP